MENANRPELRTWVEEQMSCLDAPVDLRPDSQAALLRFHARRESRRRARWLGWPACAAAAALVAGAFLLLPDGRVLAQQFWQYLTVRRVAFIRVNPWPEGAPSPAIHTLGLPIPPLPVRSLEEARRRVNYQPRLPYGV